jgi:regulatory protein
MERIQAKKWTKDNAKVNIERYCAYQERCHDEVRTKLLSHGIYGDFLEELMSQLIEQNYLNEERFALQYAGGKFRVKKWGKVKIRQALKAKGVSAYSIKEALAVIDDAAYEEAVTYWIEKRGGYHKDISYTETMELIRFLLSKGFESDIIDKVLKKI